MIGSDGLPRCRESMTVRKDRGAHCDGQFLNCILRVLRSSSMQEEARQRKRNAQRSDQHTAEPK
jgi:hypothetical protein